MILITSPVCGADGIVNTKVLDAVVFTIYTIFGFNIKSASVDADEMYLVCFAPDDVM